MIFKRSLSHKVMLWISLILILSVSVSFLISNQYYHHVLKPKNDAKITAIARNIRTFYRQLPQKQQGAYLASVSKEGYDLVIIDHGHAKTYGSRFRVDRLSPTQLDTVRQKGIFHGIAHYNKGPLITGFFADDIANTVGIALTSQQQLFIRANPKAQFGELRSYMLLLGILTLILGAMCLVLVGQKGLVKPIKRLTRATGRVATGDYHVQLTAKGTDELSQLTQSFATMTQQLAQVEKSRNEFVANVSHDLQSPLTALKGYAEQLERPQSPADQQKYLQIIKTETQRLARLTHELLLLATLDQSQTLPLHQTVDLKAQWRQVIRAFSFQLDQKSLFVAAQLTAVKVDGNPDLLAQAWQNLLTNSIRFAPEASDIQVTVTATAHQAVIRCTNFGPVIPKAQQQKLFNRFYQGDTARHDRGHSGLGLAIVQKIITLHQGTVTVTSDVAHGTTFEVRLPLQL